MTTVRAVRASPSERVGQAAALPLGDAAVPAELSLREPCVLLKLGEIVLKGRNRQHFERLLQNNVRLAVRDLAIGLRLWQREGVIVLTPLDSAVGPEAAADQ